MADPVSVRPSWLKLSHYLKLSQLSPHAAFGFAGSTNMKSYVFKVVVEPDEGAWSAHCPALAKLGAATWGRTREEALKHIDEVVRMIVEELIEDGEPASTPL